MIIFWKGNGILVALYFIAVLLISMTIGDIFLGFDQASIQMAIIQICVSLALAFPFWKYGVKANSVTHEFIDKKTGQDVIYKESHTFFFIPMQYWAILVPCLLIIGFISRFY